MDRDAVELKPCPMCSGAAFVTKGFCLGGQWEHGEFHRVFCGTCQIRQLFHKTEAAAIAAWNRRALPAQLSTETVDKPLDRVGGEVRAEAVQWEAHLTEVVEHTIDTLGRQLDLISERAPGAYLDKTPVVRSLTAHKQRLERALAERNASFAAPAASGGDQS